MSPMMLLLTAWGVMTTILVGLLIYRSTLSMHEDDQLFLDDSESHMAKEQQELLARMNKLQWPVRIFGAASALLILAMGALAVVDVLNRINQ